jgi:AcrR family transcriptional regulator
MNIQHGRRIERGAATHLERCARDRLIEAAIELFAHHGYNAIGLRDLAAQAGLQVGSLYHHIENKQGLLFELIESALSDLLSETERRLEGALTTSDQLARFVQAFVAFNRSEKHRLILISREFAHLSEDHMHVANKLKAEYSAVLSAIIATEYERKHNHDEQITVITHSIIGMLYGQSQWNDVEVSEHVLIDVLTNFVRCMSVSNQKTTVNI